VIGKTLNLKPETRNLNIDPAKSLMSDNYIEKNFLFLVALSILLHVAFFLLLLYLPQEKKVFREEPYMVELKDLPPSQGKPSLEKKEVRRLNEQRRRFPKEIAPKGETESERIPSPPKPTVPQMIQQPMKEGGGQPRQAERGEVPLKEKPGTGDFFRQKGKGAPDISKLYPSADKLAQLEEGYRKKYEPEVEEGEARFLNTDDIQFGSFLRRFETAVYGVWRYPAEAVRMGIEGVVPARITFNRKGEIEKIEILESSGSKILDDEVRRAMKLIGPVGGFPKGYNKENFSLIAFFQYGIIKGMTRGTLH
jgi:protein TonB